MITQETIIITVALVILTFIIPRRYLILPFVVAACFVPADQRIIVAELDFTVLRILVVAGVLRLWLRGEIRKIQWNQFDRLLVVWVVCGTVVYVLQWADIRSLVYKCGILFDVLGLYWLFRQIICARSDICFVFKVLAVCTLVMLPFVVYERITGSNPFVILGRVQTVTRGERYRCQASFPHSIILGLFWAVLVPIFLGSGKLRQTKYLFWAAAGGGIFIVFSTTSSTPLVTLAIILLVFALFRYRRYGRQFALGLCLSLVALHMIMRTPVWHLISRINIIGGETGYHRYKLIDKTIEYFPEWALIGTHSTAHWGWGLEDVTNQYVAEAVAGGVFTLALFVILLIIAARKVGSYSLKPMDKKQQWFFWSICVSLIGHYVAFFGVSYFGQIRMLLYLMFAIVGFIYEVSMSKVPQYQAQVVVYANEY